MSKPKLHAYQEDVLAITAKRRLENDGVVSDEEHHMPSDKYEATKLPKDCPWCDGKGTRNLTGRPLRCNNPLYHPEELKKHALSSMHEPGPSDIARALFVAVFMARESLSLAERDDDLEEADVDVPLRYVTDALGNLRAAEGYILRPLRRKTTTQLRDLAQRAVHAAEAAEAQLRRLGSFTNDDVDRKVVRICQRATETARKDAHKLLSVAMELFPDSYEKDEFFDGEEEEEDEGQGQGR